MLPCSRSFSPLTSRSVYHCFTLPNSSKFNLFESYRAFYMLLKIELLCTSVFRTDLLTYFCRTGSNRSKNQPCFVPCSVRDSRLAFIEQSFVPRDSIVCCFSTIETWADLTRMQLSENSAATESRSSEGLLAVWDADNSRFLAYVLVVVNFSWKVTIDAVICRFVTLVFALLRIVHLGAS